MAGAEKIDRFKRALDFPFAFSNCSNKIWVLWNPDFTIDILEDKDQQVLLKLLYLNNPNIFYITVVYGKCDEALRMELWDDLRNTAERIQGPWGVVGDFNVITCCEEKQGGRPFRIEDCVNFLSCLADCGLQDAGFFGSNFTWCDNRDPPNTIWERLDRLVYNSEWFDTFGSTLVTHLSRTGSDHAPLLIHAGTEEMNFIKGLGDQCNWNPLQALHQKIKNVCSKLSAWSRIAFGDIYEEPKRLEILIRSLEEAMILDASAEIRMQLARARAEFSRFLILQDTILRQKARVRWLSEGDTNSAFFHGIIKGRRKRLNIQKIRDEDDNLFEGTAAIAEAAVDFFQKLFSPESTTDEPTSLNVIQSVVSDEDNRFLIAIPSREEIKEIVFQLDPDSAPGPDGLSGKFYQSSWPVIAEDVFLAVKAFFEGSTLPKFFTHTCLVMVPKVEFPQHFTDIRPISLCNVSSKIISKLLTARLSGLLPRIISPNQSGFVKGRAISENIILAQEIVNDIGKPVDGENVLLKLDMAKAYDRYSVIVNGGRHGFFQSGRGLRQGDPLSPSLFVLTAELLSQSLNQLNSNRRFIGFTMSNQGPQINHLAFADDTILFCNGGRTSIRLMLKTLAKYEAISGQKINKAKCSFSVAIKTDLETISRLETLTGMKYEPLPIKYLGCPLYSGRKKNEYFSAMVSKVINRVRGWHLKFLSTGGKAVLIRHVLLALNIHTLAAVHPTKGAIEDIERYLARFFWSGQDNNTRQHWIAWHKLCLPYDEGGANFRRVDDICKAFTAKQWWKLRTTNSFLSQFCRAKYGSINHLIFMKWVTGQSHSWQAMCKIKFEVEQHILWKVGRGNLSFWYDNWTNFGPLCSSLPDDAEYDNTRVCEVLRNGEWVWAVLRIPPPDAVKNLVNSVHIILNQELDDTAVWTPSTNGKFSVSSAWECLRQRNEVTAFDKSIWHKDVPFKKTFMTWRAAHNRVATVDNIGKFGIDLSTTCFCCPEPSMTPGEEDCEHLFYRGQFAQKLWSIFAGRIGIPFTGLNLRTMLSYCWKFKNKNSIASYVCKIMAPIIIWELWRSRCASKFGNEKPAVLRSKSLITFNIVQIMKAHFKGVAVGNTWEDICKLFDLKLVELCYKRVIWMKPPIPFVKVNSDGSCINSNCGGGGVVRYYTGKTLMAYSLPLGQGNSNWAEAHALLFGLQWCIEQGMSFIMGETDSLLIQKCTQGDWTVPWRISETISKIQTLIQGRGITIQHCFREANQVADKLASLSHHLQETHIYTSFDIMPRQIKGLLNVDRWQLPTFRARGKRPGVLTLEPP
ncbi:uncharacterized protein LOC132601740 [Lycium barbarum]|uniref:uncharacterized protein LOC132601740 n=1 Tax=Lycium barbarum TaxID=112863 RepID=UPI00293E474E|nr:uncharacterized protein LOC132601740 [Lycium barbarum]